jgi:kynurenine formamidase
VRQWGTHVDPPAHFAHKLEDADQISLWEMILPLVFIGRPSMPNEERERRSIYL